MLLPHIERGDIGVSEAKDQETRSHMWKAIKWVAIAAICILFFFICYKVYRVVTTPARVVGNASETVGDVVKSGTDAVKQGSSNIYNRLSIPVQDQRKLNRLSEAAFRTLSSMTPTKPEGVKERMLRASDLSGNQGQVCKMSLDFGSGPLEVYMAADNDAHETAKALGAKDDRIIRVVILTGADDLALNTSWDSEAKAWKMKWKATTVSKPATDETAEKRLFDVLGAASKRCGA
jgi:hypothetical protein